MTFWKRQNVVLCFVILYLRYLLSKITIFVESQLWRFYHWVYVRKEQLLIFRRACVQNFTAAVNRQALRFAYEISAQFCHSYTPEPVCSPRNKSTAL